MKCSASQSVSQSGRLSHEQSLSRRARGQASTLQAAMPMARLTWPGRQQRWAVGRCLGPSAEHAGRYCASQADRLAAQGAANMAVGT